MIINKSDKGASGWRGRLRFHLNRGRGHLRAYIRNRIRWHLYPRWHRSGSFPDHVDLELSSSCNMVCPMCYTTTKEFKQIVPQRNMPLPLFCRIIDECAKEGTYSIRLSWRGEPLLNKHFLEMVCYAKQKGIKEVSSLTNALRLTPEIFEEMIRLQLDWLTISFDGTGDTYERIRKPAKYDEMVAKIRAFARLKQTHGSKKPVLRIQGLAPAIQEDPDRYFDTFEPLADEISVNALLDYLHNDREIAFIPHFTCPVPFQRLVIGSDGRAFMCINDERGEEVIGNVQTMSIRQIWNGPEMRRIREIHKQQQGYAQLAPCQRCYQPRQTRLKAVPMGKRTVMLEELVGRTTEIGK